MFSDQLHEIASRYADMRDVSMTTIGSYAVGDRTFFSRVATGHVTVRRAEKALRWLSDNWPETVPWPEEIIGRPEMAASKRRFLIRVRHGRNGGADRVHTQETDDPAEAAAAAHGGGAASVDVERDGVVVSVALGPDAAATRAALEAA